MKPAFVEQLVQAVLYEGYILYPYRPSSKKNSRERFTFGRVYPEAYSTTQNGAEPCRMQTECLVRAPEGAPALEVTVRFLQPVWREVAVPDTARSDGAEPALRVVPEVTIDGTLYQTWQEAIEREIKLPPATLAESIPFEFPGARTVEAVRNAQGEVAASLIRRHEPVRGIVGLSVEPLVSGISKITVRILNQSAVPDEKLGDAEAVLMQTFASTHTILRVGNGEFISAMDPPAGCKALAAQCKNIGTWPVLVGDEKSGERDTMLSSPIILYDYPSLAPESAGSFFDGTEIDEMLTLRVLTMTDAEKREMRNVDEVARRILERTEALPEHQFLKMHGTMREVSDSEAFFNPTRRLESVTANGVQLKAGDRVRLRPKRRADAMDMMLTGKSAVIEAVEQDTENRIYLAVVVDDDPGKDFGLMRQPGHRFFYGLEDIEPLQEAAA